MAIRSEVLWSGQRIHKLFVRTHLFESHLLLIHDKTGLDYPYITTLLPNDTIEIHSLETQSIVQVISAPPTSPPATPSGRGQAPGRIGLVSSINGYMVPSTERSDKMRMTAVPLLRHSDPATH